MSGKVFAFFISVTLIVVAAAFLFFVELDAAAGVVLALGGLS